MKLRYTSTSIPGLSAAKVRDLSYFRFGENTVAIACDSSGSIGELEKDAFRATSTEAGVNMVEVPLKEILSVGATPLAVFLDFCYAKNSAAEDFIASVHQELRSVGADVPVFVTFGTHTEPKYSALGLTIVASVDEARLRIGTSRPGDLVYVIGLPLNKNYFSLQTRTSVIAQILALDYVHEVLPCGSHGILYEAKELAKTNGLEFCEGGNELLNGQNDRSCGAAAAALITVPAEKRAEFESIPFPRELNLYGELRGKKESPPQADTGTPHEAASIRVEADGSIRFPDGSIISNAAAVSYGKGEQAEDTPVPGGVEAISLELAEAALHALEEKGSAPFLLINDLNFGMEPLGRRTIKAIGEMLVRRDPTIDLRAQFTGSTEDNFPTEQSGFAIHVFGLHGSN